MQTTRGEIPDNELRREEAVEQVPCGICHTISFFLQDGELVRQDVLVEVDITKFPALQGMTGAKLHGTDPSNLQLIQDPDTARSS